MQDLRSSSYSDVATGETESIMIETNLQHITPRLTPEQIVERADREQGIRIIEPLRRHLESKWERADRERRLRLKLYVVGIAVGVALAVIAILVTR